MKENVLVSVIMPAYNEEKYIREAVESVMNQDYSNLELVIADDCSDDATPEILDELSKADNRIKVIRAEKNGGCSAALNLALRHVSGDYICWLSADDKYEQHMISSSLSFLRDNPEFGACYSRHAFIDSDSNLIEEWKPYKSDDIEPYYCMICGSNSFCACTFLGEKSAFDRAGWFDEVHKYANDYDYMMKLAACVDIGYLDKITMYSRKHPDQVSNEGHNEIDKLRVYENMLFNDDVRGELFRKAGGIEGRDFILQVLNDQEKFYEEYNCVNEVAEIKRIKDDFLTHFPLVLEADKICAKAAQFINEGQALVAFQLLNNEDVRYADKTTLSILLGSIFYIAGKLDEARIIVEKGLRISPENKELNYLLEQITGRMK